LPDSNRRDANRTEENPRIDKARILKDRLEKKYAERNRERGDSRPQRSDSQLSTPGTRKPKLFSSPNPDAFGRMTEGFARYMGTPQFLMWMTIFCGVWLAWNSLAPEEMQFDPRSLNFTLLTLMLSLQASYAAPLLLLAQNRQDDRDRVVASEDRKRDQQNLEETQYLTREIASLRIALREVATRDFVRSELRDILEELQNIAQEQERHAEQLQDISEDIEDLEEAIDDIDISEGEEKDAEEQGSEKNPEQKESAGAETGTEKSSDKAERSAKDSVKDSTQDSRHGDLSQPQSRESQQAQQQAERTREGGARDR
jgi:integral membrane protein